MNAVGFGAMRVPARLEVLMIGDLNLDVGVIECPGAPGKPKDE